VYIPTKENIADYITKNLPKELHDRFTFYLVRDTANANASTMFDHATPAKIFLISRVEHPFKPEELDSKRGCDEVNFNLIG
jgi:hypothetical protein